MLLLVFLLRERKAAARSSVQLVGLVSSWVRLGSRRSRLQSSRLRSSAGGKQSSRLRSSANGKPPPGKKMPSTLCLRGVCCGRVEVQDVLVHVAAGRRESRLHDLHLLPDLLLEHHRADPAGCEPLRLALAAHAAVLFEGAQHNNKGSTCNSLTKIIFLDFHARLMMSGPCATQVQVALQLVHGRCRCATLDDHVLETHDCVFTQTEDSSNLHGVWLTDLIQEIAQPAQRRSPR